MISRIMAKITVAIALFILITSILMLASPITASAQIAAQQPTAGPLPTGVTVDNTVDTIAYMSARPKTVGIDQAFLVNI